MPDPAHILVVDDDQRLRDLLREYLTQNDYLVTTAADAAEARARLVGLEFDLIVLDVMMPGENGLELTASLRSSSQVPILLLTAMGEAGDRIAGLESGADDYLAKPFEPRELLLRIGSVLRRAAPPAEAAGKISFGDYSFDPQRGELRDVEQPVKLTSGEVALLRLFARRQRTGHRRADHPTAPQDRARPAQPALLANGVGRRLRVVARLKDLRSAGRC